MSLFAIHTIRVYTLNMTTKTLKRVNITLPEETLGKIDRIAKRGNRSSFIKEAVHFYVEEVGKENLRASLKEGALAYAKRDQEIATEWFNVDEQTWQENEA